MAAFELKRTKQCAKCPWKKSTAPFEIPDGYDPQKHHDLACTISDGSPTFKSTYHVMACHHSEPGNEEYCIGWLINQLGPGNNIPLRLKMMGCTNIQDAETYGDQHETFEQTLPKI